MYSSCKAKGEFVCFFDSTSCITLETFYKNNVQLDFCESLITNCVVIFRRTDSNRKPSRSLTEVILKQGIIIYKRSQWKTYKFSFK